MGKLNYERAKRRSLVSSRGADPITEGRFGKPRRRRKVRGGTYWLWIEAKFEGECVSGGCVVKVGDRCRYNTGTHVVQCAACAEKFGKKDPQA